MGPLEGPCSLLVEILVVAVAMADDVVEEEDEETDARSTNAHPAKWKIIPTKHAEKDTNTGETNTSRNDERTCYH